MRIVIYLRSAYPDSEQFEAQRARCLAYAAQAGYEVVAVYEDYHQSGMRTDRPSLQAMMTDAQSGIFDAVLVDKVSRLSRKSWHLSTLIDHFKQYGVYCAPKAGHKIGQFKKGTDVRVEALPHNASTSAGVA